MASGGNVEARVKAKNWCFTSFNVDNEPRFEPSKDEYLVFGREVAPGTNRPHLQGFVSFKNRQYLSYCQKRFPAAHIERARGTPVENKEYCTKDGDFEEFGTVPVASSGGGRFKEILAAAEIGDLASVKELHPGLYLRYKATLESVRRFDVVELQSSCGIWMYGPPRSGKDFAVYRYFDDLYVKSLNKWWDGYKNEKSVLLSDVDEFSSKLLGYFLKIWCDRYPFMAEVKGGTMKIRPQHIICTSNYRLEDLFQGAVLSALRSRFDVYSYDVDTDRVTVQRRPVIEPSDRFLCALRENVHLPGEIQEVPEPVAGCSKEKTDAEKENLVVQSSDDESIQ